MHALGEWGAKAKAAPVFGPGGAAGLAGRFFRRQAGGAATSLQTGLHTVPLGLGFHTAGALSDAAYKSLSDPSAVFGEELVRSLGHVETIRPWEMGRPEYTEQWIGPEGYVGRIPVLGEVARQAHKVPLPADIAIPLGYHPFSAAWRKITGRARKRYTAEGGEKQVGLVRRAIQNFRAGVRGQDVVPQPLQEQAAKGEPVYLDPAMRGNYGKFIVDKNGKLIPVVSYSLSERFQLTGEMYHVLGGKNTLAGTTYALGIIFQRKE